MLRGQLYPGPVRAADDHGNIHLSTGEVAQLGGVVDNLVHRQQGEVPGHDFHHRPQPQHGHPDGRSHETQFGDRGIDHARRPISLQQIGGHPERALVHADVLPDEDHAAVMIHLLDQGRPECIPVS